MNGPVFRIWLLLLTLLVQVGGFRFEASSRVSIARAAVPAWQDFDVSEEDGSEELSAADDAPGTDALLSTAQEWCGPMSGDTSWPLSAGIAPRRPPSDAPFKPPRA
jgi:hypothetical protein